jgi:hypothetical protein
VEFGLGDELAEVLITGACGGEEGDDGAVVHGEFGADAGAEAVFAGGAVEAGGAVNAVAVEEGEGGQGEARGLAGEVFGLRGAAEKTESAAGVEFDVAGHEWRAQSYSPSIYQASPRRRRR